MSLLHPNNLTIHVVCFEINFSLKLLPIDFFHEINEMSLENRLKNYMEKEEKEKKIIVRHPRSSAKRVKVMIKKKVVQNELYRNL